MKAFLIVRLHIKQLLEGDTEKVKCSKNFWLKAEIRLPALPRIGDEIYTTYSGERCVIRNNKVVRISWMPVEKRTNTLEPYIFLDDEREESCESIEKQWGYFLQSVQDEYEQIELKVADPDTESLGDFVGLAHGL